MYKLDFKEAEEPEIKLPTFTGSWRKQGSSRKTSISTSLTVLKSLTIWITINCGKFYKRWESQTTLSVSLETCMRIKKQHLELNMEKLTASKLGKECDKVVYCHSAYYMQSTFLHRNAGLESRLPGDISQRQICRWYHSKWQEVKTKEPLDVGERGQWKSWLETQH